MLISDISFILNLINTDNTIVEIMSFNNLFPDFSFYHTAFSIITIVSLHFLDEIDMPRIFMLFIIILILPD